MGAPADRRSAAEHVTRIERHFDVLPRLVFGGGKERVRRAAHRPRAMRSRTRPGIRRRCRDCVDRRLRGQRSVLIEADADSTMRSLASAAPAGGFQHCWMRARSASISLCERAAARCRLRCRATACCSACRRPRRAAAAGACRAARRSGRRRTSAAPGCGFFSTTSFFGSGFFGGSGSTSSFFGSASSSSFLSAFCSNSSVGLLLRLFLGLGCGGFGLRLRRLSPRRRRRSFGVDAVRQFLLLGHLGGHVLGRLGSAIFSTSGFGASFFGAVLAPAVICEKSADRYDVDRHRLGRSAR